MTAFVNLLRDDPEIDARAVEAMAYVEGTLAKFKIEHRASPLNVSSRRASYD
jgi:hypothetical protein